MLEHYRIGIKPMNVEDENFSFKSRAGVSPKRTKNPSLGTGEGGSPKRTKYPVRGVVIFHTPIPQVRKMMTVVCHCHFAICCYCAYASW